MQLALVAIVGIVTLTGTARACPAPPPMVTKLRLVTPAGTTLPPDGALLVERTRVFRHGTGQGDAVWTVRERGGASVAVTMEPIGTSVERWVLAGGGDRELEVVDSKGKVVASLRQRTQKVAPLAAPKVQSMTSTVVRSSRPVPPPYPGAAQPFTMIATLAEQPPAGAQYLAVSLDAAAGMVATMFPIAAQQVRFESASHGGKNCYGGAPMGIATEERVSLFFVDAMGRRSAATKIKIRKP